MASERLFDPERAVEVDPRDAVRVVHAFLERCAAWATERELPKHLQRVTDNPLPEHAAKMHQWTTWLAFVRRAQQEIEEGRLDAWFVRDPTSGPGQD